MQLLVKVTNLQFILTASDLGLNAHTYPGHSPSSKHMNTQTHCIAHCEYAEASLSWMKCIICKCCVYLYILLDVSYPIVYMHMYLKLTLFS